MFLSEILVIPILATFGSFFPNFCPKPTGSVAPRGPLEDAETLNAKLSALGAALGATCGAEEFRERVKDRPRSGPGGLPPKTGGGWPRQPRGDFC